jgi:hypothetical protein
LLTLAKTCLSADREARPRNAAVVASRVKAYRAGVQERLRRAELERATTEVERVAAKQKAELERKRRRATSALAGFAVLFVLAGGGLALWWQYDRYTRLAQTKEKVGQPLGRYAAETALSA